MAEFVERDLGMIGGVSRKDAKVAMQDAEMKLDSWVLLCVGQVVAS